MSAAASTDLRSAVGSQPGFAPTLRERPLRYLEPRADLDPVLEGAIINWPWRDREIALELGRSAAFVEEMSHTRHNKRAWLASIVQGLRVGVEELAVQPPSLRGRTINLRNNRHSPFGSSNMADLSILEVLMRRDGMTKANALDRIAEAKARVEDGEDPEEVLYDEFGLEPDYLFDLLD